MYENVFNRVEEKYVLTKEQKETFLKKMEKYIKKDNFY